MFFSIPAAASTMNPVVDLIPSTPLAGLLLTGGRSRRMGHDKALISVDGVRWAERVAMRLLEVAYPVIEVGRGMTRLPSLLEEPAGSGPLVAVSAGAAALGAAGHRGPALVLACDLPLVSLPALSMLASWPGDHSVVPLLDGRPQPLCARWSAADLAVAAELVEEGERSMQGLLARAEVVFVDETDWPAQVQAEAFSDFDTPDDLSRLGRDHDLG